MKKDMYVPEPIDTSDVLLSDELLELSEEEKDYDRHTAMETLKLILKLGYKIEK